MSRPLRIEYEGAWYHVINRGAGRRLIFLTDKHYLMFLDLLEEVSSLFAAEINAYCLMKNHYHLLIHTPRGNLARIMKHLNGVYVQRFNRSMQTDGPLLKGRYKSLLIEADSYLLQVSRYIHLNPVTANIVKAAQSYKWSSYLAYLDDVNCPEWLYTQEILGQTQGAEAYQRYISYGLDNETEKFYKQKALPSIWGSKSFKMLHLEELNNKKIKESRCDLKRTQEIPAINEIINKTAIYFGININDIKNSKRGMENIPRVISMLICRRCYGYKNTEIANHISKITPSAVSAIIGRSLKRLDIDQAFGKYYYDLVRILQDGT